MDVNAIMMTVAAALMLVSAVVFFVTVFFGKANKKSSKIKEKALEAVGDCSEGEFRLLLAKYLKETERAQKELVELLKKQNTLFQTQIENLEHEIYMLSEKQVNQSKSIIKFNKENARQLAISERETLEYVMTELKKAIEDTAGAAASGLPRTEEPVIPDVPYVEEPVIPDVPYAEEPVVPDVPVPEEIPEELDLSALFDDIAEAVAEENTPEEPIALVEETIEPAAEPEAAPAPAEDPLAGLNADPNAIMTPEDIAKLLEAMGQ